MRTRRRYRGFTSVITVEIGRDKHVGPHTLRRRPKTEVSGLEVFESQQNKPVDVDFVDSGMLT